MLHEDILFQVIQQWVFQRSIILPDSKKLISYHVPCSYEETSLTTSMYVNDTER